MQWAIDRRWVSKLTAHRWDNVASSIVELILCEPFDFQLIKRRHNGSMNSPDHRTMINRVSIHLSVCLVTWNNRTSTWHLLSPYGNTLSIQRVAVIQPGWDKNVTDGLHAASIPSSIHPLFCDAAAAACYTQHPWYRSRTPSRNQRQSCMYERSNLQSINYHIKVVVCGEGSRASAALSLLRRAELDWWFQRMRLCKRVANCIISCTADSPAPHPVPRWQTPRPHFVTPRLWNDVTTIYFIAQYRQRPTSCHRTGWSCWRDVKLCVCV